MSTISAQLRNLKEPDRDEQSLLFFAIPPNSIKAAGMTQNTVEDIHQKVEINAVLSLAADGAEDPYVRTLSSWAAGQRVLKGGSSDWKAVSYPPLSGVREPR